MLFDSSLLTSELCPCKSCKTQRNICRIKSILLSWYIQNAGFSLFASFLHHIECKVFENPVITSLIGISKCCLYASITSKPQLILRSSMSFQCNYQVTSTLTIAQLPKHHCKKLVPASEVFHVSVAIILAYVVVELSSIQKCSKLSENIFVLKHSSQFFLAAKLQNQVRFIAKYCIKDYNSTVSKIELPFFIGQ